MTEKQTRGLIIVFTGPGKGKTTAAMGMALRALGHGLRTLMIQFIKGGWRYGELEGAKKLSPYFEIAPMGKGFIHFDKSGPKPEDLEAVRGAWNHFKRNMNSGTYDIIILDEINYVLDYGLLAVEEVVCVLREKPEALHVVLTGRNAPAEIVEIAHLVTEMREIKHPYAQGIQAQKGVEY